ncbi:lantibiotic dehydratase [Streptosporangiaceae bacterium NEAU-GS5]|nr:lantibiotic dehydratase [Streptosporangiaceae bacterium NEAU-GS5]
MDFTLPSGVRVATPVVVRVAGLPLTLLECLRFEESFARIHAALALRERVAADGGAMSDELYEIVGAREAGEVRAALVGLRRSMFQMRTPKPQVWSEQVAAALPAELAERVAAWVAQLAEYKRLRAGLSGILSAETQAKNAVLRDVVAHPGFRRGLSYSSPALFAETARWLAEEFRPPRWQSLLRLAKYVARAAAKTSPFSTFTISGTGTWVADGPSLRLADAPSAAAVLEMNALLIQLISGVLAADPRLAQLVTLRLNPSATVVGDAVRFLGPLPAEPIVGVPATPAVLECIRILTDRPGLPPAELRKLLDGGAERIGRFIDMLTTTGLVERQIPVADLAPDRLGEMADWLAVNGGAEFGDLVTSLETVDARLRDPAPVEDAAGHAAWHRALAAEIDDLVESSGLSQMLTLSGEKDVLRESAVFTAPVAELSARHWRPALEDLDVVRQLLGALDPNLSLRVTLGAYCAERFGPGSRVPFLVLHQAIATDLAREAGPDEHIVRELGRLLRHKPAPQFALPDAALGESRVARLRELSRIRAELSALVLAAQAHDGVIRVEPGALAKLAASWPDWVTAPRSVAWYLQAVQDGEAVRLVVNNAHGGYGRGRSRALHLIRQAGGTIQWDHAGTGSADGPLTAEFGGTFRFSPNLRLPAVPYEIDYPGAVSGRPPVRRIPMNDLEVVHDLETDLARLVSRRRQAEVRALHLGMLAEPFLPPAARLMAQAFGASYLVRSGIPLLASAEALSVPDRVVAFPRVEIGRVVVQRARWVAPSGWVPVRDKGESDADYLFRVVAWLRAHGVPERCFVRMLSGQDGSAGGRLPGKSRKPVYVDFANWYLVTVFERTLKSAGPVVIFEEVLPAFPDDQQEGDFVTEFLVELFEPENRQSRL